MALEVSREIGVITERFHNSSFKTNFQIFYEYERKNKYKIHRKSYRRH
jgi:hypothetical protein